MITLQILEEHVISSSMTNRLAALRRIGSGRASVRAWASSMTYRLAALRRSVVHDVPACCAAPERRP